MAAYFKRQFIINKIVNLVRSKEIKDSQLKELEHSLIRLIKVHSLKEGTAVQPALRVNAESLRKVIKADKSHNQELQDWLAKAQLSNGHYLFPVDSSSFVQNVLTSIHSHHHKSGHQESHCCHTKQRVCVEFSSPNVAKPFHVGHLRSTIIGNVISNLYEAAGHDVKRLNFLGDWGTQFGLLTLGLRRYCDEDRLRQDPMLEVLKAYVQINKDVKEEGGPSVTASATYKEGMDLFSRLEKGDHQLTAVWSQLRTLTLSELDRIYKRLGVSFTHTQYESDYRHRTDDILTRLGQTNLLEYGTDGIGHVPLDISSEGLGRASVVKSDGSSLYLTRDIAAAIDRQDSFAPDRMHYVVEMGQRGHFTKLMSVLRQLGIPWAHRPVEDIHIRFGRVQGMSTRKGQFVHLQHVLDEARDRLMESMLARESTRVEGNLESVADKLAVSSIILQDLKSHRSKDYKFSWDKVLSLKSDSGVFVQYCHARMCSMITNCDIPLSSDVDLGVVVGDVPLFKLVLHLSRYPDVFDDSLDMLAPHLLVQYLFQLCHMANGAYAACPVKGESLNVAQARLLVFDCCRQVMATCLKVLGISPLDKM